MREWFLRRAICAMIAVACLTPGMALAVGEKLAPIVPGYVRLKDEAKAPAAEQGEVLLGELNCLQCHAAEGQKRIFTKGGPDLSHAGARLTPQYIRAYLSDNHGMKPGTTMPDLFHASDAQAKDGVVDFLTNYLVSLGGPIKPSGEEGSPVQVTHGRTLYHQIGCVACHAPEKDLKTAIPSVPFPNLAEKTTVENLTAFLMDPSIVRPGGRMPNLHLTKEEAKDIAIFLLRDQLDNPQTRTTELGKTQGLKFIYYEVHAHTAAVEKITPLKMKSQGHVDHFSLDFPRNGKNNDFAVKFFGDLHIAKSGKYKFHTSSDDGSRLYINNQLVVDNDGVHPAGDKSGEIMLEEGDQSIVVTYFQVANDFTLKCEWEGPGIPRQEIPNDVLFTLGGQPLVPLKSEKFVVDLQKAQMGGMMFSAIGCVSCHTVPGGAKAMKTHKALSELNPDSPTGCLGDQIPKSVPNYQLDADQRTALKAALKNVKELDQPLAPKQEVTHLAAAFNCYACHARDNAGGPIADRAPFFVMSAAFDMGDEGRFAPRLTNVGAKLTPEAIEQIVFENKLHVRPVLATRMPSFVKAKAGEIVDALVKSDATVPEPAIKFDLASSKDGRTLFGSKGMGCMNCHGINGVKLQGSMPAPDLGNVHDRLRYSWYRALLVDPAHINPGTRMPAFWSNGDVAFKTIAGGTMDGQIAALWSYMSLGPSMALPAGLNPAGGDELIPTDEPIVHRTFFAGAGNRSIAVGFPEMVHVVFDADVVRMAKAWKGRFFDAKGMWEGRGGNHLGPLGTDVIDFPAGPSFAVLASNDAPWPEVKPSKEKYQTDRNVGGKFKGYILNKQEQPTFHYILNETDIFEQPVPFLKAGGANLQRVFQLSSKQAIKGLNFLAAEGVRIEEKAPGEWDVFQAKLEDVIALKKRIDDDLKKVAGDADKEKAIRERGVQEMKTLERKTSIRQISGAVGISQPTIRAAGDLKQLLIPVSFNNGSATFAVEMSW